MAGGSLLALFDDIATILDDVALMTKMAAKKTAGVLGDDLALNAQQVSGVRAERELPVVWSVFKGSVVNKLILVPTALAISAIAPAVVVYLLMLGGLYLCFEGVEKLWHSFSRKKDVAENKEKLHKALLNPDVDLVSLEKEKIKGAIRTDFVLSAEIIVIALGTVAAATFTERVMVVVAIATAMTIGVYGLVALIVKLDDMGLALSADQRDSSWSGFKRRVGAGILAFCPWLMKGLSVVGTAAMFLVGGGILVHGIPLLHHLLEGQNFPLVSLASAVLNFVVGVAAGSLLVVIVNGINRLRGKSAH
jgi:predicted DNA repair protein MutK